MSNPSSPPPDRGPSFSGTKRRWPRPFVVYIYNPNPNNNIWKLNEDDYENMIKAAWTGKYFDTIFNPAWGDMYFHITKSSFAGEFILFSSD